jgi:hypothetical protein
MRFLMFCSLLLLLVLTATGCCSVVAKSGDAKILRCPQFIQERGIESYRMMLPAVSLAQRGTNILCVRDLPSCLVGRFDYDLFVPCEKGDSKGSLQWSDAKITIVFRGLDGTVLRKWTPSLSAAAHAYTYEHVAGTEGGWDVDWLWLSSNANHSNSLLGRSYDMVVTVEQPSRRSSDRIRLIGVGFAHKP